MESLSYAPYPVLAALASFLGAAVLGSLRPMLRRGRELGALAMVLGLVFTTVALGGRWMEAGRAPFKTLYESLMLLSWCTAVAYFFFYLLHRARFLTPLAALGSLTALLYAVSRIDVEIVRMPPALQSGWFIPHVVTYFVSYAALGLSAMAAALHLGARRLGPRWGADRLAETSLSFTHASMTAGFALLTFGLAMGAVWGKMAWGDYWSWDPKENWALITWLVYLSLTHARYFAGWNGRRFAWLSLAAFGVVMFTYLGMHLLPTAGDSLHVYQ